MESVLSLDDGRWLCPTEESVPPLYNEVKEDDFQPSIGRQPSPPPVLAQLQPDFLPISPSKVADPRPGPAKPSADTISSPNTYQQLHVVGSVLCFFSFGTCKKFCYS